MKKRTYKKDAFILFTTIILVVVLSFYSINIIKNSSLFFTINNHKYLHIQALKHISTLEKFILNHNHTQISNYSLNDSRYNFKIIKKQIDTNTTYYISIETTDDTNIRLFKKVIK